MNKTVLITGSSKGLGRSLALTFARNKYNVIIHGRDREKLKEVEQGVRAETVECDVVIGEISELKTIEKLTEVASHRGLTVLINNAGMYLKEGILFVNDKKIRDIIETNLLAPMFLIRRVMGMGSCEKIVNINSIAGKNPNAEESVYCASKHGLRGFTNSLQFETKKTVQIIDLYLGAMKTDMTRMREGFEKLINPNEAAEAIYSLCENYKSLKIKEINIARKDY